LLILLKPGLEQEPLNSLHKSIEDAIIKYKGEIKNREEWGKKRLAYQIQKHKEGIYTLFQIKIDPADIKRLDNDLKLNESIIRVVFTKNRKQGEANG
jgi:small subunit ribosomal protein S6